MPGSPRDALVVELQRARFQKIVAGKQVDLYALTNAVGASVAITNYGAKIQQILMPDRRGVVGDVVLGYASIDAALAGQPSMNAFIGRYAYRIAGASFTLDGHTYRLDANDGPNTLHGGSGGSRYRVFDACRLSSSAVEMRYVFGDGDDGFPGTLPLCVTYALGDDNALTIEWEATAGDKATVANFTSHPYFNLTGDARISIVDHVLTVDADRFLPIDAALIPTGELRSVDGTPMDFRRGKRIGADIDDSGDVQLQRANGYDHHYVLNRAADPALLSFAARVEEPASGRTLEVWTTEPGLQVFSGNNLQAKAPRDLGKGDRLFAFRGGLCLEPAHFPDSVHHPAFPSTVLRPGETRRGRIVYRFATNDRS